MILIFEEKLILIGKKSLNSYYQKSKKSLNHLITSSINYNYILQESMKKAQYHIHLNPDKKWPFTQKISRSLATISKLWSVPSKVLQITAARTSPLVHCTGPQLGQIAKNPPKNKIQKSVKLTDHTCSCSYLINPRKRK